ncbi:NAD(P)-dependent oxidoreductase [soil metagenome]
MVTGGAGFLGRAFVQRLSAEGWDVTGVDVRPGHKVVSGDVTRRGAWADLLEGADLVVHTAALLSDAGDERSYWDVNVTGTRTVMEACLEAGVGRALHLSSTAVLGSDFPDRATERHPVRMTGNPYTDTKVAAEHQALAFAARGLPLTVVRPGDVYGPHSAQWTVRVVNLISKGHFVLIDGGEGVMSPTYVDDLVDGALLAAAADAGRGEIFHLTGGEGVSAATFFGYYAAMLGRTLPSLPRVAAMSLTSGAEKIMRPLGLAPPFSSRALEYVTHPGTYSIEKAQDLLGWTPSVSLEAGMARTQTWLRDVGMLARS